MAVAVMQGKQALALAHADHRLNIFEGSVRSSKTITSLLGWLRYVIHGPTGNLLMVGKTERTLKRNVIDPLVEMLGEKRCRHVVGTGELWLLGRRIYLVGANNELAQGKIRGLTLAGAYVDEVSTIPQSFFAQLLARLSVEHAQLFGTTNPEGPRHWLKVDYVDRAGTWITGDGSTRRDPAGLDLLRVSFRLTDNPHLPDTYIDSLTAEYSGLWYRRFILGEWVAAEGAIYDQFDPDVHCRSRLPSDDLARVWVAVDYGTANPFHALLLARTQRGHTIAVDEWRWDSRAKMRQLTDTQYADELQAWIARHRTAGRYPVGVVVDPSAASFITELRGRGVPVTPADNDVIDGIRLVSKSLTDGTLTIHTDCGDLIDELAAYSWDPKQQAAGVDAPLKVNDHGCDALRYGLMSADLVGPAGSGGSSW